MYLKRIIYKNVGPLQDVSIEMPFNEDGSPKPLILVGENGSGKSTFLSNIVDSFYEIASNAFSNALIRDDSNNYQYYKIIGSSQITIGEKYLYSYILFDDSIEYIFKCGKISFDEFKFEYEGKPLISSWGDNNNYKQVSITGEKAEDFFKKNIICFFGPDRYERPNWMGEKYYSINDFEHPSINARFSGNLDNPIKIKNVTTANLQWLLDLIVDSRADIDFDYNNGNFIITHYPNGNIQNLIPLGKARKQVEEIMSRILKQDVYFGLNLRDNGASRFNIKSTKDNSTIVSTLDSLSTGEIALFNMFSTIIKYADKLEINNSVNLNDITGIVIIDEIELHLHSTLQKEILPDLIKLFPKVQFVITTHSPLFLLGMREKFGDNGFGIYQLPSGTKITTESFSEFQHAFDYMMSTQRYQNEISDAINKANNQKPLIITEGATDWRHIKAAYEALSKKEENKEFFSDIDVEYLEYDPKNSQRSDSLIKLEMGNSTLCNMCDSFSKLKQSQKIIFIADCDDKTTNQKLGNNGTFKNWGNNVYSIILPVPKHREATPNICIEHYYTDEEIKIPVEINGVTRRLYIGNEFDEYGRGINEEIMCEKRKSCGSDKISIIEGSQGERVLYFKSGANDNLALSKMEFADKILNAEPPFNQMSFDSFLELFRIIDEILKLPME